jgi:hypothetical protein
MAAARTDPRTRSEAADDREGQDRRRRDLLVVIGLLAVSAIGPIFLLATSPYGVHATPDSFTYLGAADQLARGRGWTYPFGFPGSPITLFPPLYPLLLAVPEVLDVSVFRWTTGQNAILLGAFCFVVGVTVAQVTRAFVPAALAALLVALGTPTITAYAHLWSEPLFFPLVVVILAALARFLATWRARWLVLSGAACSVAMLTRYAGFSVWVAACLLLLSWPRQRPLQRLSRTALFVAVSLPLSALWSLRNLATSGTLTGDNNLVHGLTARDVIGGLGTVASWFVPEELEGRTRVLLVVVAVAFLVLLGLVIWAWIRWRPSIAPPAGWPIVVVCFTYAAIHFAFIAVANAYSTRSPPFNDRILGPSFAPLVMAIVVLGHAIFRALPRWTVRIGVPTTAAGLLLVSGVAAAATAKEQLTPVKGTLTDYRRIEREIGPAIRPAALLFSNRANIAWFLTGRAVRGLPRSCAGGQVLPNPTYDRELRDLSGRLGERPRQVIFFRNSPKCEPFTLEGLMAALRVEQVGPIAPVLVMEGPTARR